MPRIVREEEYAARRNEILDVAQRLFQTRGYEQVAIQDILNELQISKGAFYHYFDSKAALLEALIDRIQTEVGQILIPVVNDPDLTAVQKLRRFFDVSARWKTAHKDYMLALLRVWYDDHNAVFRQKVFANGLEWISPWLSQIVRQGIAEGTLSTPYPEHVGEILFSLFTGLGDSLARVFLAPQPSARDMQCMESTIATYSDALERILGAPQGSLLLVDAESLRPWFTAPAEDDQAPAKVQNDGNPFVKA